MDVSIIISISPLFCIPIIYSKVLYALDIWNFEMKTVPEEFRFVSSQWQGLAFCLAFVGEDGGPKSR